VKEWSLVAVTPSCHKTSIIPHTQVAHSSLMSCTHVIMCHRAGANLVAMFSAAPGTPLSLAPAPRSENFKGVGESQVPYGHSHFVNTQRVL
jgi:hypothetical protein